MDKISVVVPIYNAEKYLEKCINSIIKQTHKNLEIILINDGSTDNSLNIINTFYQKHKDKIKVISRNNKGIGYTRNEGLQKATGEYIIFIDSDDYLELNMLEKMYNKLKTKKADLVICNYKIYNETGVLKKVDVTKNIKDETMLVKQPNLMNELNFAPWNKLYKRELFNDITFPEKYKYEDLSAIFKVCLKAKKIVKVDDYLYNYYVNNLGETQTVNERNLDMYYIIKDITNYSQKYKENNNFWQALSLFCTYRLYEVLGHALDFKNKNKVIVYINKTIDFLNRNFSNWKKNLTMPILKKIILTNKKFCIFYLKTRRKK